MFANKMLIFRAGTHKMLVRISYREDPDQTASSEAVCSGSALFVKAFFGSKFSNIYHKLWMEIFLKNNLVPVVYYPIYDRSQWYYPFYDRSKF